MSNENLEFKDERLVPNMYDISEENIGVNIAQAIKDDARLADAINEVYETFDNLHDKILMVEASISSHVWNVINIRMHTSGNILTSDGTIITLRTNAGNTEIEFKEFKSLIWDTLEKYRYNHATVRSVCIDQCQKDQYLTVTLPDENQEEVK